MLAATRMARSCVVSGEVTMHAVAKIPPILTRDIYAMKGGCQVKVDFDVGSAYLGRGITSNRPVSYRMIWFKCLIVDIGLDEHAVLFV